MRSKDPSQEFYADRLVDRLVRGEPVSFEREDYAIGTTTAYAVDRLFKLVLDNEEWQLFGYSVIANQAPAGLSDEERKRHVLVYGVFREHLEHFVYGMQALRAVEFLNFLRKFPLNALYEVEYGIGPYLAVCKNDNGKLLACTKAGLLSYIEPEKAKPLPAHSLGLSKFHDIADAALKHWGYGSNPDPSHSDRLLACVVAAIKSPFP